MRGVEEENGARAVADIGLATALGVEDTDPADGSIGGASETSRVTGGLSEHDQLAGVIDDQREVALASEGAQPMKRSRGAALQGGAPKPSRRPLAAFAK